MNIREAFDRKLEKIAIGSRPNSSRVAWPPTKHDMVYYVALSIVSNLLELGYIDFLNWHTHFPIICQVNQYFIEQQISLI